jgi:tetratricopeptide (TPR) repeat protein
MAEGKRENHPDPAELDRFLLGEMSPRQAAPLILHLLSGCRECRRTMAPLSSAVFATSPLAPEAVVSSSEYDFPLFKAFAGARQYAANALRVPVDAALSAEAAGAAPSELPAVRELAGNERRLTDRERCEALFELCRNFRYSDPEKMTLAASLAVAIAEKAAAAEGETAELADLQARAWGELGNAHRVADDLVSAEAALGHALARSGGGTGDSLLLARLMDLTASLYTDLRRFKDARLLLDRVYTIYDHAGDTHAAARTLISKGVSSNYALDSEDAIRFLSAGIRQTDPAQDPTLILAAVHGLLWCLVDCGRAEEAERLLNEARPLYEVHGEHFDQLKRLWLEGRIASHLGRDKSAEGAFHQVREGYKEADLAYDFALVSLDLGALFLRQGRTVELKGLIDEVISILRARSIQREALGALLMLKRAVDNDQATAALLQTVAIELSRLERFPGVQSRAAS